jgi:hypothetical protein
MRKELPFTQIRARQIEDRAERRFGVCMTKFVSEPSVVVDVSDQQCDWTPRGTRLGDRCRGCIDEGVVGGEPSLLIEKNGLLLLARHSRPNRQRGVLTTVRAEAQMTQEKRRDLCHIALKIASLRALSRS